MKTSDIKVNTLISFNYKKTHPKQDRLFYVTEVDSTSIAGQEFSDIRAPVKKFLTAHIVNLALVPSAKLPIEAEDYAYEIFANILKEDEDDIKMEQVFGELVGYVNPHSKVLNGAIEYYSSYVEFSYGGKSIRLVVNANGIIDLDKEDNYPNKELRTPQELAQYILTSLS